jgi:hypothetical protein
MRKLSCRGLVPVLSAVLLFSGPVAAFASGVDDPDDRPVDFEARESRGGGGTEAVLHAGPDTGGPERVRDNGTTDDRTVWVGVPVLGTMEGEDGELLHCRRTRWVRVDREEREAVSRQAEADFLDAFARLPELEGHDPNRECAVDPAEDIPPAMLRDAVTRTIRDDMPRPTVEVPPGYALTGMEAYLVTNHQLEYGPVTHVVDLGIAELDVTVTATGMTEVDWGDGTVATYHAPGTPWPDGNVTHTYRDTGIVTISVTDIWQVTYRVPALGIEDTITAPLPTQTLEDFEIQQVQAVRVSNG